MLARNPAASSNSPDSTQDSQASIKKRPLGSRAAFPFSAEPLPLPQPFVTIGGGWAFAFASGRVLYRHIQQGSVRQQARRLPIEMISEMARWHEAIAGISSYLPLGLRFPTYSRAARCSVNKKAGK